LTKSNSKQRNHPPLLIIHGTANTKIGFGDEKYPRFVIPEQPLDLTERIHQFPLNKNGDYNKEKLTAFWEKILRKASIDVREQSILLSHPSYQLYDKDFRSLVMEYFFEQEGVEKIAIVSDPFLSLVGNISTVNSLSSIIVDLGFSGTRIVPINQGSILKDHVADFKFGGYHLTVQLSKWLKEQGYSGRKDALFIRELKENFCYVRPFGEKIEIDDEDYIYYNIDDYQFKLGAELWKIPELFFFKDILLNKMVSCPRSTSEGKDYPISEITLTKAIGFVIQSLNPILWAEMFKSICITGGGAMFQGFFKRLQAELQRSYPQYKEKIKLHSLSPTNLSSFYGASKLSMLESFSSYWTTREDYEEGLSDIFL
jgi:actin-related protein